MVWLFTTVELQCQVDTVFSNFKPLSGKYFSESEPGTSPEVFAPNLLNSKIHHLHSAPAFTSDMLEMYFSVYINNEHPQRIFVSKKTDGYWQKPELASFSGVYQDGGPVLSPDGNTLFYYSKHPDTEGDEQRAKSRIRYVTRENGGWSKSKVLEFTRPDAISFYPSHYSTDGTFYFFAEVGKRDYDIFKCRLTDNKAYDIERLDDPVSFEGKIESGAVTDPENRIMIYFTYGRAGENKAGLYHRMKQSDGTWGNQVLFEDKDYLTESRFAGFTPDGKYFFFLSYKEGHEQIYWVSSEVLFSNYDMN